MWSPTEEALDIFWAALLRPVGVLQVPHGSLLARQQVFDLQTCCGVAARVGAELGGHLELAVCGRVVLGPQLGPVAVTLGASALLETGAKGRSQT